MRPKTCVLSLLALLLVSNGGWAFAGEQPTKKDPPISVKAEVDRAFITIGDPVHYTVTVKHAPQVQVLTTIPPPSDDIFKIKKIEEINRQEGDQIVEGRKFTLTAFRLGEFILDPIQIQYRVVGARDDRTGEIRTIETNRLFLTVESVAKGEPKTDIRGVKGVLEMITRRLWLWVILFFGLLGVAGLWFYYRHRRQKEGVVSERTVLDPADEALQALSALFDSDLLRKGYVKEYYLRLSEILRTYFEKRFSIQAVESTTYEILVALKSRPEFSTQLRETINEVLNAADLAKFAKWRPQPVEIVQINQRAKQIIEGCEAAVRPVVSETPTSSDSHGV